MAYCCTCSAWNAKCHCSQDMACGRFLQLQGLLPPVRQLHGNKVTLFHPQTCAQPCKGTEHVQQQQNPRHTLKTHGEKGAVPAHTAAVAHGLCFLIVASRNSSWGNEGWSTQPEERRRAELRLI
ncbi:unnamed protein product, partial [Ectocarpus sp. 8 AP-2014]